MVSCQAPGWRRLAGVGRGVLPGQHDPDGQRVRSRVLHPPLEGADRQGARFEIAADDGAQLLADEADPEHVRLEGLPGAREEGVVGAGALGQGPAPGGQGRRPERREDGRLAGFTGAADEDRESVGRDGPERMLADLEVPAGGVAAMGAPDAPGAEAADRHAGPRPVVDHPGGHVGMTDVGTGLTHRPAPGDRRDPRRRVVRLDHVSPRYRAVHARADQRRGATSPGVGSSRSIRSARTRRSDHSTIGSAARICQRSTSATVAPGASSVNGPSSSSSTNRPPMYVSTLQPRSGWGRPASGSKRRTSTARRGRSRPSRHR